MLDVGLFDDLCVVVGGTSNISTSSFISAEKKIATYQSSLLLSFYELLVTHINIQDCVRCSLHFLALSGIRRFGHHLFEIFSRSAEYDQRRNIVSPWKMIFISLWLLNLVQRFFNVKLTCKRVRLFEANLLPWNYCGALRISSCHLLSVVNSVKCSSPFDKKAFLFKGVWRSSALWSENFNKATFLSINVVIEHLFFRCITIWL